MAYIYHYVFAYVFFQIVHKPIHRISPWQNWDIATCPGQIVPEKAPVDKKKKKQFFLVKQYFFFNVTYVDVAQLPLWLCALCFSTFEQGPFVGNA